MKNNEKKLIFSDDVIRNYYLSLKTKPFVILMGLSGSGKTKLALRFAKAMTKEEEEDQFEIVPVEAGWIGNKALLGYYNPLTRTYQSTPFLKVLLRAYLNYISNMRSGEVENIKPYFIILDEMNLSKVEYYFSKFLSIFETMDSRKLDWLYESEMYLSEPIELHQVPNYVPIKQNEETPSELEEDNKEKKNSPHNDYFIDNGWLKESKNNIKSIPPRIHIPPNLYFTGTVNVDETTYMFSPKVLDRANSIELNEIKFAKFKEMIQLQSQLDNEEEEEEDLLTLEEVIKDFTNDFKFKLGEFQKLDLNHKYITLLKELNEYLKENAPQFNFGYRVMNEIFGYIEYALRLNDQEDMTLKEALDFQLKQKILPKIHGMKSELNVLFGEKGIFNHKYLESIKDQGENEGEEGDGETEDDLSEKKVFTQLLDFPNFIDKIKRMKQELDSKHFTSYM